MCGNDALCMCSLQVNLAEPTCQEAPVRDLVRAAMGILRKHLSEPVHLTLLNLGATNFVPAGSGGLPRAMSRLFRGDALGPPAEQGPAPSLHPAAGDMCPWKLMVCNWWSATVKTALSQVSVTIVLHVPLAEPA